MSKSEQQKMCEIGSTILSCAIPKRNEAQHYRLRSIIFLHIKANKTYKKQIGLIEEYYDDKWSNFALVLKENGDLNNAEQLVAQVIDMRKKLLGAEHPATLTSMAILANTYRDQGRWDEAELLFSHVYNLNLQLGAENPDTLTSKENQASTYRDQGRWNDAEQLEVQVMDMRKKLLGAEHLWQI